MQSDDAFDRLDAGKRHPGRGPVRLEAARRLYDSQAARAQPSRQIEFRRDMVVNGDIRLVGERIEREPSLPVIENNKAMPEAGL